MMLIFNEGMVGSPVEPVQIYVEVNVIIQSDIILYSLVSICEFSIAYELLFFELGSLIKC